MPVSAATRREPHRARESLAPGAKRRVPATRLGRREAAVLCGAGLKAPAARPQYARCRPKIFDFRDDERAKLSRTTLLARSARCGAYVACVRLPAGALEVFVADSPQTPIYKRAFWTLEVFTAPPEEIAYKQLTTTTSPPNTNYCGALKLTSSSSSFDIRSKYEYTAPCGAPSSSIPTARRTTSSSSGWPTAPTVEP